ncbi:unnamed protein product [Peniophora sp. CBMAI 1063]|nr:unnamed protein product [Peniophora sp. CBMAI 1063]
MSVSLMAPTDSYTFTVGKLDAGMAILLGERAHLIEFPSLLLPPGASAGSIVNISVTQNLEAEHVRDAAFWKLQDEILDLFGSEHPKPPELTLRNVTQTSVALEWPPLQLATASLRSLDIYRNGVRLAPIPSPLTNTTTKLSGLELDTEYTFRLVLRTTAGTFPSNVVRARTHTMADTSGISVCFGTVEDSVMLEHAKLALQEMRAKFTDKIAIDTTHFVCTTPAAPGTAHGQPGVEYQRALQLSIPIVQPQWILACHQQKKMVPIASFYLGATPAAPMNAPPFARPQSMSQTSLPQSSRSPPVNPAHGRAQSTPTGQTRSPPSAPEVPPTLEPTLEEEPTGQEIDAHASSDEDAVDEYMDELKKNRRSSKPPTPHARHGTMDQENEGEGEGEGYDVDAKEDGSEEAELSAPGQGKGPELKVEVPPPPSPAKEKDLRDSVMTPDEEVGETEEISLN